MVACREGKVGMAAALVAAGACAEGGEREREGGRGRGRSVGKG